MGSAMFLVLTVASGQLQVVSPDSVRKRFCRGDNCDGEISCATSAFGEPVYGEVLTGSVIRYPPGLNNYCDESGYDLVHTNVDNEVHKRVFLVDRGGCSIEQKVLLAEQRGAHAVIVCNNISSDIKEQKYEDIVIASETIQSSVTIPSVLISHEDGQLFQNVLESSVELEVEFDWKVPMDHTVTLDVWHFPNDRFYSSYLKELAIIVRKLNGHVIVRPHFHVEDGSTNSLPVVKEMCWKGDNRYCLPYSIMSHGSHHGTPGCELLDETVRQMCFLSSKNLNEPINRGLKWMDYIYNHVGDCGVNMSAECSYAVMNALNFDVSEITSCTDGPTALDLLDEAKKNRSWKPIAIMVNDARFYGSIEALMGVICDSLHDKPYICHDVNALFPTLVKDTPQNQYSLVSSFYGISTVMCILIFINYFYKFFKKRQYKRCDLDGLDAERVELSLIRK